MKRKQALFIIIYIWFNNANPALWEKKISTNRKRNKKKFVCLLFLFFYWPSVSLLVCALLQVNLIVSRFECKKQQCERCFFYIVVWFQMCTLFCKCIFLRRPNLQFCLDPPPPPPPFSFFFLSWFLIFNILWAFFFSSLYLFIILWHLIYKRKNTTKNITVW